MDEWFNYVPESDKLPRVFAALSGFVVEVRGAKLSSHPSPNGFELDEDGIAVNAPTPGLALMASIYSKTFYCIRGIHLERRVEAIIFVEKSCLISSAAARKPDCQKTRDQFVRDLPK